MVIEDLIKYCKKENAPIQFDDSISTNTTKFTLRRYNNTLAYWELVTTFDLTSTGI